MGRTSKRLSALDVKAKSEPGDMLMAMDFT
jgi:hypothetical protein